MGDVCALTQGFTEYKKYNGVSGAEYDACYFFLVSSSPPLFLKTNLLTQGKYFLRQIQ